jgi:hypothetical protein
MQLQITVTAIEPGDTVKVPKPGPGEQGSWRVLSPARSADPTDQNWEVVHLLRGNRRIFRQSRLRVVRPPKPRRPRGGHTTPRHSTKGRTQR